MLHVVYVICIIYVCIYIFAFWVTLSVITPGSVLTNRAWQAPDPMGCQKSNPGPVLDQLCCQANALPCRCAVPPAHIFVFLSL